MIIRVQKYLPNANAIGDFSERSLKVCEEFESITAYFKDVIEKCQHAAERESTVEHTDETELYEHLQVVVCCVVILEKDNFSIDNRVSEIAKKIQ